MSRQLAAALALLALTACHAAQKPSAPASPKPEVAADPETIPFGQLAEGEPSTPIPVEADDLVIGSAGAKVTIVAFLDFECPYCMEGFATIEELRSKHAPGDLRVVLKHMPLESHSHAFPAALAAQAVQSAAGPKAGYEFAKTLFTERELGNGAMRDQAEKLGVEHELYTALVEDEETEQRVRSDVELGHSLGVTGTPAFFINGRLVAGAVDLEEFEARVAEELEYVEKKLNEKNAWSNVYTSRIDENMRASLVELVLGEDPNINRVIIDGSAELGPKTAPLTMVVFSDFECPFCKRADATVVRLKEHYGPSLRLVWKHLPLPFHKNAMPASRLAELVRERQGDEAFFRFTRSLFEASPKLDETALRELGEKAGLKGDEITEAMSGKNERIEARLARDADLAEDLNARGTPAFFINGRRVVGARPLEHFQAVLDYAQKEAQEKLAQGAPTADYYESLIQDGALPGVPEAIALRDLTDEGQPTFGPKTAPITIHVFSDFECPFCRRAETQLTEFKELHKSDVRWVWHDLPLPFHKHAMPAARAAREAFRQKGNDGFWKMHELLFGMDVSTSLVSDEEIQAHARELKLRPAEFQAALDGKRDAGIVRDQEAAKTLEISGTPTFVIQQTGAESGFILSGAQPPRHFERAVQRLLKK